MTSPKPKIEYRYLFKNDGSNQHKMGIAYTDSGGGEGMVLVPPSWQFTPTRLRDELADADAQGDLSSESLKGVLAAGPNEKKLLTTRTSWFDEAFVLPYRTINPREDGPVHEDSLHPDLAKWTGGRFKAWKKGVREICDVSDFAVFAIAVGLSGPLLTFFTPAHGLIFNLAGPQGGGKTTALRLAQSVLRRVTEDDIDSANMTPTALEEHAAENHDMISCADEFGAVLADKKVGAAIVKQLAYGIRQGHGKKRSRATQATMGYRQLHFRACMMTSSEELLSELFGPRMGGEEVRVIDIMVPDKKEGGIFVRVDRKRHWGVADNAKLASDTEGVLTANYGKVLPRFVKALSADLNASKTRALALCKEFVDRMINSGRVAPEGARHLQAFGRVYAAGMMAINLGLLPVGEVRFRAAMRGVFERSELGRRDMEGRLGKALVEIAKLASDERPCQVLKKSKGDPDQIARLDAVARETKGNYVVGIRPEVFRALAEASGVTRLDQELSDRGILMRGPQGATKQLMVCGKKQYFYCINIHALVSEAERLGVTGLMS